MAVKNNQEITKIQQQIKSATFWLKLISLQALLFIIWLLSIPKEAGNAFIFGFSLKRLALLIPLFLPAIAATLLKWGLKIKPDGQLWLSDFQKKSNLAAFLIGSGFLISVLMVSAGFLYHFMSVPVDINIYIRLLPIITNYFLLGVEAILFVPIVLYPSRQNHSGDVKHTFPWLPFCITFGILLAGLLIVTFTGLGIDPERVSIISLGSPLLEGQIWYITILLVLLMTAAYAWKCIPDELRHSFHGKTDLFVGLVLWLIALVLWMSLPLPKNNYFAPQVQAPNFEKYPFSDAEQYDFNSLYVYFGSLKDFAISKPLYVSLLALFHAIAGLSYDRIIFLQTLLVAFFPPVLYLIGKELHSRMGGIAIALFAIMREVTAIQATSIANISSTKLLLSDMPATLLAGVLALMLIRWFKSDEKKVSGHEFIIGGLVGMFILTRIQTLALIPFILLLSVVRYFRNFKSIIISALILLFSIGLVVSPILMRNHAITGVYWIDNPSSSSGLSRIMTEGVDFEDDLLSDSSNMQTLQRNRNLIGSLIQNNFGDLLDFTADNFMRNGISSILTLPVRLGNNIGLINFLTINAPFWMETYSKPNLLNMILFVINFTIISLGFAVIYRKNPLASLSILGFHFAYSLSSAVVRLSGWRFILPVDWLSYGFFAVGIVEILKLVINKLASTNITLRTKWLTDYPDSKQVTWHGWGRYAIYGCLFIFIGAAIPLREKFLPALTPEFSKTEACRTIDTQILQSENKKLADGFFEYCVSDKTQVLFGYGIYPRFFEAGEGFYDRISDPWFGKQPYPRLVFRLIGTRNGKIYIQSNNKTPNFPNGALVYAVGSTDPKLGARVVFVNGAQTELIISSGILSGKDSFSK